MLGFLPAEYWAPDIDSRAWFKALICTQCGDLKQKEVTEQELDQADERLLQALDRHGFLSEEESRDLLG